MRRACNQRLSNAMYHWARVAIQHDPVSRERYAALRARGQRHGRALRTVADRLLAVACAMLRDRTPSGGRYEADSDAERPAAGQSAVNAGPERVRVPRSSPRRRSCCRSCPSSLELNRRAARGCTSGAPRRPQQRPIPPARAD